MEFWVCSKQTSGLLNQGVLVSVGSWLADGLVVASVISGYGTFEAQSKLAPSEANTSSTLRLSLHLTAVRNKRKQIEEKS
jgi:hypothetical protein